MNFSPVWIWISFPFALSLFPLGSSCVFAISSALCPLVISEQSFFWAKVCPPLGLVVGVHRNSSCLAPTFLFVPSFFRLSHNLKRWYLKTWWCSAMQLLERIRCVEIFVGFFFIVVMSVKALVVNCGAWSKQWLQDFSIREVTSAVSRSGNEVVPTNESLLL